MTKTCLIGCSKRKLATAAPAETLYTSTRFQLAKRYSRQHFDAWYVLSALHGLLPPDRVVEPYDRTLNTMRQSERKDWSTAVAEDMHRLVPKNTEITILAGRRYIEFLAPLLTRLGYRLDIPLARMTQGAQLHWLKRKLDDGK
jgi:hypothetical protein